MKIKLDECIPGQVAETWVAAGHDVHTVNSEQLSGAPDDAIWRAAQVEERFLITTDLDFSDIRQYQPGSHYGILLIRLSREGQNTTGCCPNPTGYCQGLGDGGPRRSCAVFHEYPAGTAGSNFGIQRLTVWATARQ